VIDLMELQAEVMTLEQPYTLYNTLRRGMLELERQEDIADDGSVPWDSEDPGGGDSSFALSQVTLDQCGSPSESVDDGRLIPVLDIPDDAAIALLKNELKNEKGQPKEMYMGGFILIGAPCGKKQAQMLNLMLQQLYPQAMGEVTRVVEIRCSNEVLAQRICDEDRGKRKQAVLDEVHAYSDKVAKAMFYYTRGGHQGTTYMLLDGNRSAENLIQEMKAEFVKEPSKLLKKKEEAGVSGRATVQRRAKITIDTQIMEDVPTISKPPKSPPTYKIRNKSKQKCLPFCG